MMQAEQFSSLQKFTILPPSESLLLNSSHQFSKNSPSADEKAFIDSDLATTRDELIDKIEKKINIFWPSSDFRYKFPLSLFPDVPPGSTNNISYEQDRVVQHEDTFVNRLTPQQVDQIRQKGEFEVVSNHSPIPYTWRINECLLKGRVSRVNIWEDGLAWCYSFMRLASKFFVDMIPKSCKNLVRVPLRFFDLIFGRRRLRCIHTPNSHREALIEFWSDIMQNELSDLKAQIGHQFLQCLFVYYDPVVFRSINKDIKGEERKKLEKEKTQKETEYNSRMGKVIELKNELKTVDEDFETNWKKIRKAIFNKVSTQIVEDPREKSLVIDGDEEPLSKNHFYQSRDDMIVEKLMEQKYLLYVTHMKQNLPKNNSLSQSVVESLLTLISIFNLIGCKLNIKKSRLWKIEKKIREDIKNQHSIRSRNEDFVHQRFQQLYSPIEKQIESEIFTQIEAQLEGLPDYSDKYKTIMRKYSKFLKQLPSIKVEKQKRAKSIYVADRVFESFYILFPPYEVVQTGGYYSLKKHQTCQIQTGNHFWKCCLYGMRFKCWSLNCLKACLGMCWAGPVGLRCLFGIDDFTYDEGINSSTGQKYDIKRKSYLGIFCTVLEGIKKSRQDFQAKPDLGILGKNCSRLCNIIECYIFRFFIVGVIGVLMCYPVAILICSSFFFIGVLTFWIWVPLLLIIVYLFNILVFQFEISVNHGSCLIKSFPLISLSIQITYNILVIIAAFLFLLIIAPFICFIYILFLILQRILRTITDSILACFLGCCGRTPSVDTCMATKVSGPGMSNSYYRSIAEEDVYILVQAWLQKIVMKKIQVIIRQELQKNVQKYDKICCYVLKPFGYSRADIREKKNIVETNTRATVDNFNKQMNLYMNRYPKNPLNVRFTQEEIESYFQNSIKIVKNFVQKNGIHGWIFRDHELLHEDYDELTRKTWSSIFGYGDSIFEPLEKVDERFKLESTANTNSAIMKQNVTSISKAIKGEVDLSTKKVSMSPAKRSLLDKDYRLDYLTGILECHSNNSLYSIWVNEMDPSCLFVPHRNTKEIKEYDLYDLEGKRDRNDIFYEE